MISDSYDIVHSEFCHQIAIYLFQEGGGGGKRGEAGGGGGSAGEIMTSLKYSTQFKYPSLAAR